MKYLNKTFSVSMNSNNKRLCDICKEKEYIYNINGKKYCRDCYKKERVE